MWVQFQVSFSAIYGFKRQAIIRWPINGIGKYTKLQVAGVWTNIWIWIEINRSSLFYMYVLGLC